MSAAEEAKLAAQWPKRCACGRVHARAWWLGLELARTVNAPDGRYTDAYATMELRNCECGSTLAVLVEIHDLAAE